MKDIEYWEKYWEKNLESCKYSHKLIERLLFLNTQVNNLLILEKLKKVFIMLVNIMVSKCVNQVILITLIQWQ